MKNKEKNTFMKSKNIILKFGAFKKITRVFLLFLLIFSCGTPKDIAYFQGLKNKQEITALTKVITTYKPQDIISIVVSAEDPETALPFNISSSSLASKNGASNLGATSSTAPMYLLDANGMIEFPVIGQLKIANLSNVEVKTMIKKKLKTYIKNPIVTVKLENFKITILGEVNNPGPFTINNEQINILEAIGLAGDLSISGKRTNITVIRVKNNKQIVHKLDLSSQEIFNSPVYYLAQNDIIYVEPNTSKKKASRSNDWLPILTSITSVLGIIISVIAITR
ncbi:MAG: polysaccharide biosynthesis/export family protein [Polaribacter sp.]